MKLLEYQSKKLFRQYGIPVPAGQVTSIARDAKHISEEIGLPVVVKAQVLVEGRGAAGGIRLVRTPEEAEIQSAEILSQRIHGLEVRKVQIDEAISIEKEYFLLITFDRSKKQPLLMMYDSGTIYIETAANALFDHLERVYIDPLIGLQRYQIRQLAYRLDFPGKFLRSLGEICFGMWHLFSDLDARMVAINPLAITNDQRLLALDGKITLDPNAQFRHASELDFLDNQLMTAAEIEAHKHGLEYIKLPGDISCMVNGAGLTMATLDMIADEGGFPANFLDLGSGVNNESVNAAMKILLTDPDTKVVIINIFGGIIRCGDVAAGVQRAMQNYNPQIPILVHFDGNDAETGYALLRESRVMLMSSLSEAIKRAVEIAGGNS